MWPFLIFSILIVVSDQLLKLIVFSKFSMGENFPIIKGILYVTPTYNTGIAFGFLKELNIIPIVVSIAAVVAIAYILAGKRPLSGPLRAGMLLVLSGAIGNLIDRIVHGHVLDFIDFRIWPVFNIADSAITVGTIIIVISLLNVKHKT